jgi:hypothetical protein
LTKRGLPLHDEAEIRSAILKVTRSPITHWVNRYSPTEVSFITKDGTPYRAEKSRAKWHFTKPVVVAESSGQTPNHALAPTPGRCEIQL